MTAGRSLHLDVFFKWYNFCGIIAVK
jgi:hypothetical protein